MSAKYTERLPTGKRCALTGDVHEQGYLDLGAKLADTKLRGNTFIAIRSIQTALKDAGYLDPAEASTLKQRIQKANERLEELKELREFKDRVLSILSQIVPTPEPEVMVEVIYVPREPTEEERNNAIKIEESSAEEWWKVYRGSYSASTTDSLVKFWQKEQEVPTSDEPVDVKKILDNTIPDVMLYAQSAPEDTIQLLMEAEKAGKNRETLLSKLMVAAEAKAQVSKKVSQ